MRLRALREELRGELSRHDSQQSFDTIKQTDDELARYPSIFAVLAVLQDRAAAGYDAQDRVLRRIVGRAQSHPDESLWRRMLLYAFLPGLIRIRARTVTASHSADDVDAAMWTAFFETVHSYPLQRVGSVAAGILLDTRKRYFKALAEAQTARQFEFELVAYARQLAEARFDPVDHQEPNPCHWGADDLQEMREVLRTCALTSTYDADLLWATEVEGLTVRQYMKARGLVVADPRAMRREEHRLGDRRRRARQRLFDVLRKKIRDDL